MDSIRTSPRREKPQNLDGIQATRSLNENCGSGSSISRGSDKRLARNRSRCSETRSHREHSSDGVMSTTTVDLKADVELCNEFDDSVVDRRRESLNFDDNSPCSQSSFTKTLLGRTMRLPSMAAGSTTRKCVLTLDGYSYVIVASTPENLPKRDDLSCLGGSNPTTVCNTQQTGYCATSNQQHFSTSDKAAFTNTKSSVTAGVGGGGTDTGIVKRTLLTSSSSTSTTETSQIAGGGGCSENKKDFANITSPSAIDNTNNISITSNSSASAINGQVARHGALTIVRRSNSRKSFSQHDSQHLFSTAITTPTPASSQSTQHNLLVDQTAQSSHDNCTENLSHCSTVSLSTLSNTTEISPANSNNTKIYRTNNNCSGSSNTISGQNLIKMLPTSPNQTNLSGETSDEMENTGEDLVPGTASGSINNSSTVDFGTDNLPAVDTPDACDKAALRLRSLLHMLNTGEIQADVLQKNLHYAARVLEAVFLDESKSPTSGKSKLRQNSCSSVECEDQGYKRETKNERCNSDCKNVDCNQHQHTTHSPLDPNAVVSNENNNINTTCSILGNAAECSDISGEEINIQAQNASNNQISIDSRTKGVCSVPQTHSGPTGPPVDKDNPTIESVAKKDEIHKQTCSNSNTSHSSVSNSSCSNKATIQKQKRLRTPVWARSTSTNKTYITFFKNL